MDRYRGLLERYVELYNAGDLDGVMDLYAEDAVQLMPDGTFEGRSAIRDRLAKELAAFADIAHRYVSYVEQGDAFADEWVFVGTHTGPLLLPDGTELAATGKRVEIPGMEFVKVRDGKIVVDNLYYDNLAVEVTYQRPFDAEWARLEQHPTRCAHRGGNMDNLEVIARLKIRPGQLEGFKSQAAEILRATREQDTHTLRCDWFINEDGTECEVHELFPNEQGLIEHKMNTMAATVVLFSDYAFDHHATIYGDVSQGFIDLVTERMGPPTVFAFTQGLQSPASVQGGALNHLQVIARVKVRPGQLEGFQTQAAVILRVVQEQDTQTLRYDWFINQDETDCEVHEAYLSEQGLIEHNQHVIEVRDAWFRDFAFDHRMSVYGEISQHLSDLFTKHAGGVSKFSLAQGLDQAAPV